MGNSLQYTLIGGKNSLEDKSKLLTKVTYLELKSLRDNGKLIPGSLYRLTDYECTTTQENTRSAGHQFDIVLLALSENKLAEEGWAMEHPADVYNVTFADGVTKKCYLWGPYDDGGESNIDIIDCETLLGKKGSYCEFVGDSSEQCETLINAQTKTAITHINSTQLTEENLTYNYFQNSNLSAWKVWYCLDNDTSKFAWADDSVDGDKPAYIDINADMDALANVGRFYRNPSNDSNNRYCWTSSSPDVYNIFTDEEIPTINTTFSATAFYYNGNYESGKILSYTPSVKGTNLPNGHGVIYRLIDEWNNDCPYDFKNILYLKKLDQSGCVTNLNSVLEYKWVYTFNGWDNDNELCIDASVKAIEYPDDENIIMPCSNNKIYAISAPMCGDIYNTYANILNECIISHAMIENDTGWRANSNIFITCSRCSFSVISDSIVLNGGMNYTNQYQGQIISGMQTSTFKDI